MYTQDGNSLVFVDDDPKKLKHYDVLGMRWGVIRSKRYRNKVKLIKANRADDLKKAKSKTEQVQTKQKYKRKLTEARVQQAVRYNKSYEEAGVVKTASEHLGKSLLKRALLGSAGTIRYNEMTARGNSRYISYGEAQAARIGNLFKSPINKIVRGATDISDGMKADKEDERRDALRNQ